MAVTVRKLSEEQKRELLESRLVKAKGERSPGERADAARRAMSGIRFRIPVSKDEYRA